MEEGERREEGGRREGGGREEGEEGGRRDRGGREKGGRSEEMCHMLVDVMVALLNFVHWRQYQYLTSCTTEGSTQQCTTVM